MFKSFCSTFLLLLFTQSITFGIKNSPFRPNGNQGRQSSVAKPGFRPPSLSQKPSKQEDHSKEVEFRGYYFLNGKGRFCIYNLGANYSEWIYEGQSTYEGFSALSFNEDSETLTVSFKNTQSSFDLNLYGPSIGKPGGSPSPKRPAISAPKKSPVSAAKPKFMPPVPTFKPRLPASVVSSNPLPSAPSLPQFSGNPSPASSVPAPRSFPVFPGSGFPQLPSPQSSPSVTPSPPSNTFLPGRSSSPSIGSGGSSPSVIATDPNQLLAPLPIPQQDNEINLSNLPPPPPPPNIPPPSAPPDIQPSRAAE